MKIAFLDEDGMYSNNPQANTFDWVVMNTRETIHKQEHILSANPLIFLRLFCLKIKELKERCSWVRVKFDWQKKTFFSVGCALKARDQNIPHKLYNGLITFEELIKPYIKRFVNKAQKDFQIAFIFESGWIRHITFREGELFSSRLISLKETTQIKADFIICDTEVKSRFPNAISSTEFGSKIGYSITTLREFVLNMDFGNLKDVLIPYPSPEFKSHIFSFHGKKQIFKLLIMTVCVATLCWFQHISYSHLLLAHDTLSKTTITLEENIKKDTDLKKKKEFATLFASKKMGAISSFVSRIQTISFLQEYGFYAQIIHWDVQAKESMRLLLKAIHPKSPKEILKNFALLEQKLKHNAEVIVHKPPFGIDKTRGEMRKTLKKKPSSRSKIEIVWNTKK